MAAPVTHFEINAKDAQRVRDFYSSVFGWKVDVMPEMSYGMVDTGVKMGINGGIGQVQENGHPSVIFYIQVEDVQSYLDKAMGLGGRVVVPLTEVPNMVAFAQFSDPEGNIVGLVKGPQSPPKPVKRKKAVSKKKKAPAKAKKVTRKKGKR